MMFIQRRLNVDATSWRCIDVEATLYRPHVSAGLEYTRQQKNIKAITQQAHKLMLKQRRFNVDLTSTLN